MTAWIWLSQRVGCRLKACSASWKNECISNSPFKNKSQKLPFYPGTHQCRSAVSRIKIYLNSGLDIAILC